MNEREEQAGFIALAASEIRDGDVCFIGIGVPSLAAMLAKRHHAPKAVLVYESGALDARPPSPPLSTGSPSVIEDTAMLTSCLGVFAMLQQGRFHRGYLSAAQVDRRGNLNSTELRRPDRPPLHLVGSGGAHDIMVLAREVVIMMPHDPRRFVEQVDFVTSPGFGAAFGTASGRTPRGAGPACLVTPRARFSFDSGEMTLEALAPGFSESEAVDGIPWQVRRAANVHRLPPFPPALLRDAAGLVDGWGRDVA